MEEEEGKNGCPNAGIIITTRMPGYFVQSVCHSCKHTEKKAKAVFPSSRSTSLTPKRRRKSSSSSSLYSGHRKLNKSAANLSSLRVTRKEPERASSHSILSPSLDSSSSSSPPKKPKDDEEEGI
jgi:hypothetical protein